MASVLIFFEYVLTFDEELRFIWRKKLTGAVGLFLANRYTTILSTIYYILITVVPATYGTALVSLVTFH